MSHFAQVKNGVVVQVIVAEQDVIDTGLFGDPAEWVQTSYNTYGGKHEFGGTPLRMNYACIGGTYDAERDAFIPPKPFEDWVLDPQTCLWVDPNPKPETPEPYTGLNL